jgi:hypothetical protein
MPVAAMVPLTVSGPLITAPPRMFSVTLPGAVIVTLPPAGSVATSSCVAGS